MSLLNGIDRALRTFIEWFSRVPDFMGRIADRVLESLRNYTDTLVRIARESVRIFGHFMWELFVALMRIAWNAIKLGIMLLLPLNMLGFGMSGVLLGHPRGVVVGGWILAAAGGVALGVGAASVLSSFRGAAIGAAEQTKRGPGVGTFLLLDCLALGVIAAWAHVMPTYKFEWWPLGWEQNLVEAISKGIDTVLGFARERKWIR